MNKEYKYFGNNYTLYLRGFGVPGKCSKTSNCSFLSIKIITSTVSARVYIVCSSTKSKRPFFYSSLLPVMMLYFCILRASAIRWIPSTSAAATWLLLKFCNAIRIN